jgi:plastocyanin
MKQFKLRHVGYLLIASVIVSCSKSSDDTMSQELTASATATKNTVRITNTGFSPTEVNSIGATDILWVNDDERTHNVTLNDGSFNSGDIPPGGSASRTFNALGHHPYHCSYHLSEKGMISITGIK